MKTKALIGLILLLSSSAAAPAASPRTGNGGDGVRVGGALVLLDFLESGVEAAPYLKPGVEPEAAVKSRVANALPFADAETQRAVAVKLTEIHALDPISSWTLLKAIELFSWGLVSPALLDLPDEDTNLDIDPAKLEQLAVRSGRRIQINRNLWEELHPLQRAGLIFHETVYGLAPVQQRSYYRWHQDSSRARSLVGYLFSPRLTSAGREGFREQAKDILPHAPGEAESFKISAKNILYRYDWSVLVTIKHKRGTKWYGGYSAEEEKLEFPSSLRFPETAYKICHVSSRSDFQEASQHQATVRFKFAYSAYAVEFKSFDDGSPRLREYLRLAPISADDKSWAESESLIHFGSQAECTAKLKDSLLAQWKKFGSGEGFGYLP